MIDTFDELLLPYLKSSPLTNAFQLKSPAIQQYLNYLTTLSLSDLKTSEPQCLSQSLHTTLISLQALSKRSYNSIIYSDKELSTLRTQLLALARMTGSLRDALPKLDNAAIHFSETYHSRSKNILLERRQKALLLSRNVDRLSSILELPSLLSTAVSSSNQTSAATLNYASALDLNAHIRRMHTLHPDSALVASVEAQSRLAMQEMTSNLINSLKFNTLKLASAMRTISWLRRIAPELNSSPECTEGALGALFLVCRLANLRQMLGALEPLRELADSEKFRLSESIETKGRLGNGQQTERYLKRYIEIFREQSFAIISMYRSIFLPSSTNEAQISQGQTPTGTESLQILQSIPSALSTFPLTLVNMLADTLRKYLPNVKERSNRDSLLTQVLYCAGSLGRLGGDFSLVISILNQHQSENMKEGKGGDAEWVEIIRKHRILAGRLELMVGSRDTSDNILAK